MNEWILWMLSLFILAPFWMIGMFCSLSVFFLPWVVSEKVDLREFPHHLI
jgi:hypothetical protein